MSKKPGPAGRHPLNKTNRNDDGEIEIAISIESGCVIFDFGASVAWLGMTPAEARRIGLVLIAKADAIEVLERLVGEEKS